MAQGRLIDLTGGKYGRMTVIKRAGNIGNHSVWLCICECGKHKEVRGHALTGSKTRSCGCLASEVTSRRSFKHGMCGTTEYYTWEGMVKRCRNMRNKDYYRYGGRGIGVCERWMTFENFLYDMGKKPTRKHSIDRIDNDKGYSAENCRWATGTDQARNRRSNVIISHNGVSMTMIEWSERLGVRYQTMHARRKKGWAAPEILYGKGTIR